jgi:pyridoxal phosphate enzyme (YggS family)
MSSTIRENIQRMQYRIARARQKSPYENEVTLIAVSKTHPAESVREAYEAGLRHFGENRVQEWEGKRDQLQDLPATWHLVGHLQSNKSARAAKLFHAIDSVDDFSLAQRLNNARAELAGTETPATEAPNKKLRILLEVHIENEATKSGASIDVLPDLLAKSSALDHLELAGLMCIPPFLDDPEKVRPYFRRLKKLRDDLSTSLSIPLPVLSMGMSHDFEVAIEEGATEVRIGTAIFGMRPKP